MTELSVLPAPRPALEVSARPAGAISLATHPLVLLVVLVGLGVAAALINLDLPVVRNALLYAQISENLTARGMRLWEVCSNPDLAFNKACGFAVVATPLIAAFGPNAGLISTSCLGSVLFILAGRAFFLRFCPRFGLARERWGWALLIACFNPLFIYQFWSAYPDTLFNAGFLISFVLLDRIISGPGAAGSVVAYLLVFLGCAVVKHGTTVMFPLHVAYALWHRRALVEGWAGGRRGPLLGLALAFVASALFFLLGRLGLNPLLNLEVNRHQLDTEISYPKNVREVGVFLLLTLGPLVLLLPRLRINRENASLFFLLAAIVHLYSVYMGAAYNARYFLGSLPLLALFILQVLEGLRAWAFRRTLLAAFLVINTVLISVFNLRALYSWATAGRSAAEIGNESALDNLRMLQHLASADALRAINERLPLGARLIYISAYYGDGGFRVYERSGMLRPDLQIDYVNSVSAGPLGYKGPYEHGTRHVRPEDARGAYLFYQPPFGPNPLPSMAVAIAPLLYQIP